MLSLTLGLTAGVLAGLVWSSRASSEVCAIGVENGKIAITGEAKVEDGDTIWVGIHKIRLHGIEALEEDQPCVSKQDTLKRMNCSERSIVALTKIVEGKLLKCLIDIGKRGEPVMSYNRYLAICYLPDGTELNRKLVSDGWVLADASKLGDRLRPIQLEAEQQLRGIHTAKFDAPKDYRASKNKPPAPCPSGFQCMRTDRTDLNEALRAIRTEPAN